MTLVDLPGIARLPVGDQPPDVEARTAALCRAYIAPASTVILAVTPAHCDLVTSDALRLARDADPSGCRTLGVLTKADVMEAGTDVAGLLAGVGGPVPLALGYVAVANRGAAFKAGAASSASSPSLRPARAAEASFFAAHPAYAGLGDRCGAGSLAARLNAVLADAVRGAVPHLRGGLEAAAAARAAELAALGDAPPGAPGGPSRGASLLRLIDAYASRFTAALQGGGGHEGGDMLPLTELAGGARVRHVFRESFLPALHTAGAAGADLLSDAAVRTAIRNAGGVRGSLLIPDAPFEALVRRATARLLPPSLACLAAVRSELARLGALAASSPDLRRFPALSAALRREVAALIDAGAGPAERMIRDLVACELAYINTDHPAFCGGGAAVAAVMERRAREKDAARGGGGGGGGGGGAVTPGPGSSSGAAPPAAPAAVAALHQAPAFPSPAPGLKGALRPSPPVGINRGGGGGGGGGRNRRVSSAGAATMAGAADDPSSTNPGPGPWWTNAWRSGGRAAAAGAPEEPQAAGPLSSWDVAGADGEHAEPSASFLPPLPATLTVPSAPPSDAEAVQVEVTRTLVREYLAIVVTHLADAVPKAVMHFLVAGAARGLHAHLVRSLYREEAVEALTAEAPGVAGARARAARALGAVRAALAALDGLPAALDAAAGVGGQGGGGGARAPAGGAAWPAGPNKPRPAAQPASAPALAPASKAGRAGGGVVSLAATAVAFPPRARPASPSMDGAVASGAGAGGGAVRAGRGGSSALTAAARLATFAMEGGEGGGR